MVGTWRPLGTSLRVIKPQWRVACGGIGEPVCLQLWVRLCIRRGKGLRRDGEQRDCLGSRRCADHPDKRISRRATRVRSAKRPSGVIRLGLRLHPLTAREVERGLLFNRLTADAWRTEHKGSGHKAKWSPRRLTDTAENIGSVTLRQRTEGRAAGVEKRRVGVHPISHDMACRCAGL